MSLYSIWQSSTLDKNRFVVGTKLSTEINLVRQISSVMPDRIGNCTTIQTNKINANDNVNTTQYIRIQPYTTNSEQKQF